MNGTGAVINYTEEVWAMPNAETKGDSGTIGGASCFYVTHLTSRITAPKVKNETGLISSMIRPSDVLIAPSKCTCSSKRTLFSQPFHGIISDI